jgi:predicted HTH domain antitoxin
MKQINFRVSDDEYTFAENMARILGKTVPLVVKEFGLKALHHASIDIALELYKGNKIGLKSAWIMTGLTFHEFTALLMERNIEPPNNPARVERAIEDVKATRFEDLFPGKSKEEVRRLIKVPEP